MGVPRASMTGLKPLCLQVPEDWPKHLPGLLVVHKCRLARSGRGLSSCPGHEGSMLEVAGAGGSREWTPAPSFPSMPVVRTARSMQK
jgi:hypothetical protein